ncbi:MAG: hypothetical protein NVS1B14_09260 [Vulcanimicrobiaceae bacterium]
MSNFQNLDLRKQHQALPLATRMQIVSYLSNKDRAGNTTLQTLSIFAAGFLGKNFTYYLEQPVVDSGLPGKTEQVWLSWNGLFGGANSFQLGKYHTPFPFMPAHGWTLSNYLLATQDSGQNVFEPNASHWGLAFNGMSNDFMYNLAYLTGEQPLARAFDYNRADAPRTLDFNLSYGGMTKPWQAGVVLMRGATPLRDAGAHYVADDIFSRSGMYYSYQTPKYLLQTMLYHGFDHQPDIGAAPVSLNGYMVEVQRDIGWKNHLLVRYDVAASDTLNRQYVVSFAHHVMPNFKATGEISMSPLHRAQIGFALDWAGPFQPGQRFLWKPPLGAVMLQAATPAQRTRPLAVAQETAPDANRGAALIQNNGCTGCHGARLQGGAVGPKLTGIEKTLAPAAIADFIKHPRAPMPDFGFSDGQIADIVSYLSTLDGGATGEGAPVVILDPAVPADRAKITVRFASSVPTVVSVRAIMRMGAGSHRTDVSMHATSDPHVWEGVVSFSMGGPWILEVTSDGKTTDLPVQVGP